MLSTAWCKLFPMCPTCGHGDHGSGPCGACAQTHGTCWQRIAITGGDGDTTASGQIEMATGLEKRPCLLCVSFERDQEKLIRHLVRNKLTADENGIFTTPIAKDFPGRKSLRIDPKSFGWCRHDTAVVDMLATCPSWRQVRTSSEFESRIKD